MPVANKNPEPWGCAASAPTSNSLTLDEVPSAPKRTAEEKLSCDAIIARESLYFCVKLKMWVAKSIVQVLEDILGYQTLKNGHGPMHEHRPFPRPRIDALFLFNDNRSKPILILSK
ncbi:hypothetical protein CRV24_008608 [Beauveria bassiana]|nr:hypothetical protein CRV24_008608 [Beauveria bassiana]